MVVADMTTDILGHGCLPAIRILGPNLAQNQPGQGANEAELVGNTIPPYEAPVPCDFVAYTSLTALRHSEGLFLSEDLYAALYFT